MRAARLQDTLERLTLAIRDVESELAAMKVEHDPLASHIFVSRRHYRNINDTKSGKRRAGQGYSGADVHGLRVKRYGPRTTSRRGGSNGAGRPRPTNANINMHQSAIAGDGGIRKFVS